MILPYLKLIKKHGFPEFVRLVLSIWESKLFKDAFSKSVYHSCMKKNIPYLGSYLQARQGVAKRHFYMKNMLLEKIAKDNSTEISILEVGSYAGASALTWATSLKEVGMKGTITCVDPWELYISQENLKKLENSLILSEMQKALNSNKVFQLFQHNIQSAGVKDYFFLKKGYFSEVANSLQPESYDIIYIDGDHSYKSASEDLKNAKFLLKKGGIMCGDDLEVQWQKVAQKYCENNIEFDLIVDPKTKTFFHPGVSKAVYDFFHRPISEWNGFWAVQKEGEDWKDIEILNTQFKYDALPDHLKWWEYNLVYKLLFTLLRVF